MYIVTASAPVTNVAASLPGSSVEEEQSCESSMVAVAPKFPRAFAVPELHGGEWSETHLVTDRPPRFAGRQDVNQDYSNQSDMVLMHQ